MPKQANQVTNRIKVADMPRRVKGSWTSLLSDPSTTAVQTVPSNEPLYCPTTRRIILISSVPGVVHGVVRTLSDACFDVMVFHRWEPEVQRHLGSDLLIYDLTATDPRSELLNIRNDLEHEYMKDTPVMYVVQDRMSVHANDLLPSEEVLIWPLASSQMVHDIERMIVRHPVVSRQAAQTSRRTVFKDIWIDRDKMLVYKEENPLNLTKTEYDLLLKLIDAQGKVISREQMMHDIWETDFVGGSNVVDVHVKSLRKKLDDRPAEPEYIATVRGVGYRLAD
ncbi:winged helix-turn-helix domain-containing protein [Paenibacillus sp. CMAA1739]|uniref:winged helix-turn-helix domain-containing protein n=1 Tax=Paenibacillus ottowii TaxID=2315729 RepID=UPI002731E168|nr:MULTISPECIES: winged helix-turn-helix domain-containing protein [Paenibacillus]MDP1510388.1 winged helix-turn-helix domain-containing protein [Paenibacillus ottowii]MEC4565804.1 winged helix-turn-helix domain-containing protein [Paenibacillus sp. CMAA1739]